MKGKGHNRKIPIPSVFLKWDFFPQFIQRKIHPRADSKDFIAPLSITVLITYTVLQEILPPTTKALIGLFKNI